MCLAVHLALCSFYSNMVMGTRGWAAMEVADINHPMHVRSRVI